MSNHVHQLVCLSPRHCSDDLSELAGPALLDKANSNEFSNPLKTLGSIQNFSTRFVISLVFIQSSYGNFDLINAVIMMLLRAFLFIILRTLRTVN